MRLGIDAKWYFSGPISGRTVVNNIVDGIVNISNHTIVLFFNLSDKENVENKFFSLHIEIVYLENKLSNMFCNLFELPRQADSAKIDALLYQNFTPVLRIKHKAYSYIHDVLFLDYPQYFSLKERLYLSLLRLTIPRANHVITISNSEKSRLIKHELAEPNGISVVYHGIAEKFVRSNNDDYLNGIKNKYNLPDRFILIIGRLNIRKNLPNLLRAFNGITDETVHLVIAGKQDHKQDGDLFSFVEGTRRSRIILTGFIENKDIVGLYNLAELFCFPSFAEGFGLPPLEAMACGVPCVISNRTCLPEIFKDKVIYIEPSSPMDIASKINHLLSDSVLKESMSKAGQEYVSGFSWLRAIKEIEKVMTSYTN